MLFCSCYSKSKITPNDITVAMDEIRAKKYGISLERYYRILDLPQMTPHMMDVMYTNGWDFTDTSLDLLLFAEMQTFRLESIKEQRCEDDELDKTMTFTK